MSDYTPVQPRPSYVERWKQTPMLFRVVLIVGLIFIFYYLVIDTEKRLIADINEKSDQLSAQIDYLSMDLDREHRQIIEGATHFGRTTVWTMEEAQDIGQVGAKLNTLIRTILRKHDIETSVSTRERRDVAPLPGSSEKVQGISAQVQFTVSPDVLPKILSDIEREPKIARISSVAVSRVRNETMLLVTIVAEAWWKRSS